MPFLILSSPVRMTIFTAKFAVAPFIEYENWYGRGVTHWTSSLINYNIWKKQKEILIVGLVPRGNKYDSLFFSLKWIGKKSYRLLFMLLVNMHILVILSACVWLEICQNVGGKVKVWRWCKCIWFLFINRIDYLLIFYWYIAFSL